jgi:hypothetical protein
MDERDDDPGLFGLDGRQDPAATDARTAGRRRWLPAAIGLGAAVVATAVALAVGGATNAPAAPAATSTAPETAAASAPPATTSTASSTAGPPTTTVTPEDAARAQPDLSAVAARLDTPLELASPADWDQWLPGGKPYPGGSTEEEMATCPRLADRLSSELGTEMSYWTGTLPQGPVGCSWATVPLSYDGPYDYAYTVSVGFLADGTTEQQRVSFYHHQGRICPGIDVPSAGAGTVLVRCEADDGIEYAVAVPDTRSDGVWVLIAKAQDDAEHPSADVLVTLLDGVVAAYAG